jgi:hypothetical protein
MSPLPFDLTRRISSCLVCYHPRKGHGGRRSDIYHWTLMEKTITSVGRRDAWNKATYSTSTGLPYTMEGQPTANTNMAALLSQLLGCWSQAKLSSNGGNSKGWHRVCRIR